MTTIQLGSPQDNTGWKFDHDHKTYQLEKLPENNNISIPLRKIMLTDAAGSVQGEFSFDGRSYAYRDLYSAHSFPSHIILNILRYLNKNFHPIQRSIINALNAIRINGDHPPLST